MDRKGIIAVALSLITLFAWTFYNSRELEKTAAIQRAAAAQAKAAQIEEEAKNPTPAPVTPTTAAAPTAPVSTEPVVEEKIEKLTGPKVEYTFSNLGGGIAEALLITHEAETGRKMAINEFGPTPIGAVSELAGEGARLPYIATRDDVGGTITFERTDARQLQVMKKFTIARAGDGRDEYTAGLDLTFTNRSAAPLVVPGYFLHTGAAAPVHQKDLAIYTGFKPAGGKFIDVNWFNAGGFLMFSHPARPIYTDARPGVGWLGVTNQYFSTVASAQVATKDLIAAEKQRGVSVWAKGFEVGDEIWKTSGRSTDGASGPRHAVEAALGMPGFSLEPGKSLSQSFLVYTGPREYSRLARLGGDEEKMMDFGMFGVVSKTLLNAMNWLHAKLGSYAAAIVVLTLIIKSALWPLQNKATQSMKRMQLLQPKMTELREKYSDDPTRMNTETMKLYRDYGVNPVSGCLPMVVQIPIFFGFYNMLGKAVELRNSTFLWVHDLSQPDTVANIAGINLNILPLVMAVTMFWQMAISPKSGDQAQQRIFMFMPLIFIFFCYNFASALALYWTVQNLFSVAQLYATRNQAAPQLKKVTAPAKKK